MSAHILPLRSSPRHHEEGDSVDVARPFPRIEPGVYEALSVSVRRRRAFKREYVEALFDIYEGLAIDGHVIGRLPGFFRLTGKLAPSSSLGRWIQLLGTHQRRDRVSLRVLENKLWRVELRDVIVSHEKGPDGKPRPLPPSLVYSRICAVIERLA